MIEQTLKQLSLTDSVANNQEKLIIAVRENHFADVKHLIENGVKLNAPYYGNLKPPLYWAVVKGNCRIVELLIKHGAYINYFSDENKNSLLDLVLKSKNSKLLRLLLENGADPTKNCESAIQSSDWKRLRILIRNGAHVDTKCGSNGITPLYHAVMMNKEEKVKAFIKMGANPNSRAFDGTSPLHFAIENENKKIAKLLLNNGAQIDIPNEKSGAVPIHLAMKLSVEIVKFLLKNGANPNAKSYSGMSPLHFFAISRNSTAETVKLLIEKGACINALDARNHSPLYLAIEDDNFNAVKVLFENGARVQDCEEIDKSLFLIRAISNLEDDIAELLVENGADLEIKTSNGCNALAYAMLKNRYRVFESLIRNGANINTRAFTSIHDLGTPLIHLAVKLKDVKYLKLLLENGALIEEIHNGMTPMMLAVTRLSPEHNSKMNFEIVMQLFEHGANLINALSLRRYTLFSLLHEATRLQHQKFVNVLLNYDDNQHLRNDEEYCTFELTLSSGIHIMFKTMSYWNHGY